MKTSWRLIDSGPCSAAFNMALDEAIAVSVRRSEALPTLRFYGWTNRSLTLGSFQRSSSIDRNCCEADNIPIIRRPTGGRAILHGDELTYSVSARIDTDSSFKRLMESYCLIGNALNLAFSMAGIGADTRRDQEAGRTLTRSPLCFESSSIGEIMIGNRKLVGSAQRRWKDGFLQQGSVPFSFDREKMLRIFGTSGTLHNMAGIRDIRPDIDADGLKENIAKAFEELLGISLSAAHPAPEELLLAAELQEGKYLQDCWNFRL